MADNDAIVMGGGEFREVERSILVAELGKEKADKVIAEADALKDELDPELQEIIDGESEEDEDEQ